MDIEQAYRILDLQPGATLRQIAEARDELRILWDPDRLARHPGLHVKAPGKIEEIEQAYEVLMNHLGRTELAGSSPPAAVSSSRPNSTQRPQASLFEEVFSKQGSKAAIQARRAIPGWVLVVVIAVLGMCIGYFIASSSPTADEPDPASIPASRNQSSSDLPSELTPDESVSGEPATGQTPSRTEPVVLDPPSTGTAPLRESPETSGTRLPTPSQSPFTATRSGSAQQVDPTKRIAPAKPRGPRPVLIRSPAQGREPVAGKKEAGDSGKVVKPSPES